jgi:SAM-dependent methyltransferase
MLPPVFRFYLRTIQGCLGAQLKYLKRGALIKASRAIKVYLSIAANILSALRLLPRRRYCEFCDWAGFVFIPIYYVDGYRAEVFCPRCRLMDRYRTLVYFARRSEWAERIRKTKPRLLDVAPTKMSGKMLAMEFGSRETIGFDISNPWADVLGDLQYMPFESASFDLFVCYEVLDYIPNDEAALTELHRVLKPGAYGLLRVGFDDKQVKTVEYAHADADDSYHIRRYGRDLPGRLRAAGFETDLRDLTEGASNADRIRLGLDSGLVFLLRRLNT